MSTAPSRTAAPSRDTGSHTVQQQQTPMPRTAPSGVLRLRAEPEERRHIQWAEDVVDNEGMGKKSSKVCCIYHAPREAGESSDESSDSSSSDDDSEVDDGMARPSGGRGKKVHGEHEGCEHGHEHGVGEGSKSKKKKRAPSPNAYEKIPKPRK